MRPDTNSIRPEALQNSLVSRHIVDRGSCWSLGAEAHHAGTEASLTKKGRPTRAQRGGAWCKQFRQPLSELSCFPQVSLFFAEGQGGKWHHRASLFSETSLCESCYPQGSIPILENNLLPMCPNHFSDQCFHDICSQVVVCFLSGNSTVPSWLYPSQVLTFEILGFQSCWLQEIMNFSPSHFPSQWLRESILPVLFSSALLSFALLCKHSSLPSSAPSTCFSPKSLHQWPLLFFSCAVYCHFLGRFLGYLG